MDDDQEETRTCVLCGAVHEHDPEEEQGYLKIEMPGRNGWHIKNGPACSECLDPLWERHSGKETYTAD